MKPTAEKPLIKGNKKIYYRENGTKAVETINEQPSMTEQQFKDECDVNNIIRKYVQTGTVTHVRNAAMGVYADLTQLPDYQTALDTVMAAEAAFNEIPAKVRARFGNDPQQFIEFLADPANDQEAVKLGLKVIKEQPKPDPVLESLNAIKENTKPKKAPAKEE